MENEIQVEVCYATPEDQCLLTIIVPKNTTVQNAILSSKILERFPELKLEQLVVGIFGKKCTLQTPLSESDRVEIYRPLTIDPKVARRLRAAKRNKDLKK